MSTTDARTDLTDAEVSPQRTVPSSKLTGAIIVRVGLAKPKMPNWIDTWRTPVWGEWQ
jgi:hypothetical protein